VNQDTHDILISLISGFIGAMLSGIYNFAAEGFRSSQFKIVFGENSLREFYMVYGRMVLKQLYTPTGQIEQWPYVKPETNMQFRFSSPVSFAETKSAKYLSEAFSKRTKNSPVLISDDEIKTKLDLSFCTIGGFNNFKSIDIIMSDQNKYYEFDLSNNLIKSKISGKAFKIDSQIDYGVIIKIYNKNFPDKTQICIAGLGEYGTSGATWYLSKKWRLILKKVGANKFGCLIKVKIGQDESAELVEINI
jgi:hypothetical protein